MGDLFRSVLDFLRSFWPFAIVEQWERGGYYVRGRWWKEVGPGLYVVAPWFTDIKTVSVATAYAGTGRQDVTLSDGRTLMFQATVKARVRDVNLALNTVDDFKESTAELAAAILAERLAEVEAERLTPAGRGRLLATLRGAVKREAETFGIEVLDLYFTSFIVNARTFRLLGDGDKPMPW